LNDFVSQIQKQQTEDGEKLFYEMDFIKDVKEIG
jgi:hypothetical protein